MATTYDVWFRSGSSADHYREGDNVSLIEITNTDQDYYQNGVITLFDAPSSQQIGNPVMVKIDGTLQFDGYVARRQQEIKYGKKVDTYQLVGKTYDLWRYHTNAGTQYSGATCFIASSLVADFCPGISSNLSDYASAGGQTPGWSGTVINDFMDFSNETIGDALVRLTEIDGFKFYVNPDGILQYYKPGVRLYDFTITEDDIFDMSPVEEADEDLFNDVTVIGSATGYTTETNVSTTYPSSKAFPNKIAVAQRFKAEDERLAAVKLYVNRTIDPNQPEELNFEIWEDSSKQLYEDDFTDGEHISYSSNTYVTTAYDEDALTLSYATYKESYTNIKVQHQHYYAAQTVKFSNDVSIYRVRLYVYSWPGTYNCWCFICPTSQNAGESFPDFNTQLASGSYDYQQNGYGNRWINFNSFDKQAKLSSDKKYAIVFTPSLDGSQFWKYEKGSTVTPYPKGKCWYSADQGQTWDVSNRDLIFYVYGRAYETTGFASSNVFEEACQYLKLDVTVESSCRFYASATNDGGATWATIITTGATAETTWNSSNKWWDFGSESSDGAYVKYIFSGTGTFTPKLTQASVEIGDINGSSSGSPESGNKVEWGDSIDFNATDFPYPPSYNSWKTYTFPKLRLTKDRSYWMVMWHNSSNSKYWSYYYDPKSDYTDGRVKYSWDEHSYLTRWSGNDDGGMSDIVPSGNLTFSLGWSEAEEIVANAQNQDSIDTYGRHYKLINDSTIMSMAEAQARADLEVSGSGRGPPKKGSVTIDGRTDMETYYRFSSNLTNFGIDDIWDVVSYTQRINEDGFTTEINYGRQPFDLVKHIADLEQEVYGG